jgi:microcystin-dependent protein
MKINVYTIDIQLPRWLRKTLSYAAVPAVVLAGIGIAYATVPVTFVAQTPLKAADLNSNFTSLDTRVTANVTPPGVVVAFAGTTVPAGWLLCDGSAVSRTTYAGLFGVIGITHGGGDGTTTFNVPDYRGRFLRGVDGDAGVDPDTASRTAPQAGNSAVTGGQGNTGDSVGSVEADQFAAHQHNICTGSGAAPSPYPFSGWSSLLWSANIYTTGHNQGESANVMDYGGGGSETRPKNVNVNYIIKL